MLKRRIKAPKVFQGQPGRAKRAKSSTKTPKPQGITPGKPAYGILHSSRYGGNGDGTSPQAASKANRLFGTGSRNIPGAQGTLTSKAKRQVG